LTGRKAPRRLPAPFGTLEVQMLTMLFWNLGKSEQCASWIGNLAVTYSVDIFLFAEFPDDASAVTSSLNAAGRGRYWESAIERAKVRLFTRLADADLTERFTSIGGDMSIWDVKPSSAPPIRLAAVHLPAMVGGYGESDLQSVAQNVARELSELEDEDGHTRTVLVGDMNMNPYASGMVIAAGFHALMTKRLAGREARLHRGERYRRFYNPMWGLFGDRTPGLAGTHFWKSSAPSNTHWGMLDQVLLRPELMDELRNILILEGDGCRRFVAQDSRPSKDAPSDHFPVFFSLNV
jgi:endonuclease/exonuclease/phosphatase family metal-dependent hydrolase